MLKVKAVLFQGRTYKDGTHPIMIRITKDRKHTYISCGHSIPAEAWDEEHRLVYEKSPRITNAQERSLKAEQLVAIKEKYKRAII